MMTPEVRPSSEAAAAAAEAEAAEKDATTSSSSTNSMLRGQSSPEFSSTPQKQKPQQQQRLSCHVVMTSPSSADTILGISHIAEAELEELYQASSSSAAASSSAPSSSSLLALSTTSTSTSTPTSAAAAAAAATAISATAISATAISATAQSFPVACRAVLLQMEGNSRCLDCSKQNPEWAAVSYGAMVCLQCAGSHRSLGVNVSTVRSVTMDHWRYDEVVKMLEGGNRQLSAFFQRHALGRECVEFQSPQLNAENVASMRYKTKAALFYRQQLEHHVQQLLQQGPYKGRRRRPGGGGGGTSHNTNRRKLGTQSSNLE